MQMLYNSDSYAVVQFDVAELAADAAEGAADAGPMIALGSGNRRGYELVDKFARKGIFLQGAMADTFKEGVEALIKTEPSEEEIDDYIGRFASLMQQPVILH